MKEGRSPIPYFSVLCSPDEGSESVVDGIININQLVIVRSFLFILYFNSSFRPYSTRPPTSTLPKSYPHKSPSSFYWLMWEIPPALYPTSTQAAPAEPERTLCARPLSAHPVPLLFLSKSTQDMSLFGIFRAKVTRPWEPSKGTCPIGHCAVGTLPAAFLFLTGQRHGKKEVFRKTSSALPCLAPRGRPD